MKRRAWLAALPVAIFTACGVAAWAGVRVNTTASVPVGLWHVGAAEDGIGRGDRIAVCVPPWPNVLMQRGDCPYGTMPLVKPVAAIEGDVVQIDASGVSVNGHYVVGPAPPPETFPQPVPRMPDGTYRVYEGEVWVLSGYHERSFDSRYFGPVRTAWVRGRAKPLLVMR